MNHSENALKIYKKLYFHEAFQETRPEQVHERVAKFIANDETEKEQFLFLLNENIFRPNTPCLIHAGVDNENLAACFVLSIEDNMNSIIDLWTTTSKIYASGAGAGFRITKLREKGSPLSKGGTASGPVAYIRVNDCVSSTVKSGGRHRRAANLGVFDYNHPDTMDIVGIKEKESLESFNLSMLVKKEFMDEVVYIKENVGQMIKNDFPLKLISPNPMIEDAGTISGMMLWNKVIDSAWRTGDPGLLFYENINKHNPFPSRSDITCANPCSEIVLPDDSMCVIGSINIGSDYFINNGYFDFNKFFTTVKTCNTFLDNIIDKTSFIHPRFEKIMKEMRPVGLGIMGFADLLVKFNIEYGSEESILLFKEICENLTEGSFINSILACKNGKVSIPMNEAEKKYFKQYLGNFIDEATIEDFEKYGIRNSTVTCIAPTGSISISSDCSYSFEPLSAIIWEKELAETHEKLYFCHPEFEKWLNSYIEKEYPHYNALEDKQNQINETKQDLLNDIVENHGSLKGLIWVPEKIQRRFRVAHDIDPMKKIEMQAAGQRYITMGISSTCNLPNSATKEDIEKIFIEAYKKGLKGITVYRDGCKEWQPINFGKKKEDIVIDMDKFEKSKFPEKKKRPLTRTGETFEIKTPEGKLFVTCNKYPDSDPMEVWITLGGAGSTTNVLYDQIAKLISIGIQHGIDIREYIKHLRESKDAKFWFFLKDDQEQAYSADSILDAIGIILEEYFVEIKEKETIFNNIEKKSNEAEICPECGQKTLVRSTGCRGGQCTNCFYTNCS